MKFDLKKWWKWIALAAVATFFGWRMKSCVGVKPSAPTVDEIKAFNDSVKSNDEAIKSLNENLGNMMDQVEALIENQRVSDNILIKAVNSTRANAQGIKNEVSVLRSEIESLNKRRKALHEKALKYEQFNN